MTTNDFAALAAGRHADPFAVLGPHRTESGWRILSFQPQADAVSLIDASGSKVSAMRRVDASGIFLAEVNSDPGAYQFQITQAGRTYRLDDAYRFQSVVGETDEYLIREGTHRSLYKLLGAHVRSQQDVAGVHFTVWAPNASAVSVVGDFNAWDDRRHPMRKHPATGIFDLFYPGAGPGDCYQYCIRHATDRQPVLKSDPFGQSAELPPARASRVYQSTHRWQDDAWMKRRTTEIGADEALNQPMAIYEVHAGSWRRDEHGGVLDYRALAERLVPYVKELGFTHIEFMPLTAHPFDASWGYQPIGLFAADPRYGEPDDLRYLIDCCHEAEIGVIVDWVPAHFPRDEHGLAQFDGTALYEHADSRRANHPDWGTLEFNLGRTEVANYLISNALFWIKEFHVDVLRVDAVASMLYLDYSRKSGEWAPNIDGGNEDLEAVAFLRKLNEIVHAEGGMTAAEESTSWPMVSRPTSMGGLGFTFKWNMGWMNDTLLYIQEDPINRKYHHDMLTFGLLYAFNENFILPLSHDEVVHGKGSILSRMPGDDWQKFANVRLYYCFQYAHPGKKLLFMGNEFAQGREWDYTGPLAWDQCEIHWHRGVQELVTDLNRFYGNTPALYRRDFTGSGFSWILSDAREDGALVFVRWADTRAHPVVAIFNFTPVVRDDFRIGVPLAGRWVERLNTDDPAYGGAGNVVGGELIAEDTPYHGQPYSITFNLPPLAGVFLQLV